MSRLLTRRRVLQGLSAAGGASLLAGCDRLGDSSGFQTVLRSAEKLTYRAHRLITPANALAREFARSDMSPVFRVNGNRMPRSPAYQAHMRENFANWRLEIGGLVARPMSWTLAELRALPTRSQITRHDCVEGWSAIGQWGGPPLKLLLDAARIEDNAEYVVFHCADDFDSTPYYESIDLVDAFHPQTILAHTMNDRVLPVAHGAPVRLRVERQLGYKHAKFVMRIEVVESLGAVGRGRGGFWEDEIGYEWYAGI
jgi:DMSO/TMAO reductase YedYZ molybdopterin-dependent catalytic subunit